MGTSIHKAGIITDLLRKKRDISGIKDKLLTPEFSLADIPVEWRNENE